MTHEDATHSRRTFIKVAAATAVGVSGCNGGNREREFHPTPAQLAMKKQGRSIVGIARAESYEENLFDKLKPLLNSLELPDLKGKNVVIKPNMIEFRADRPVTTNPRMIEVAAQLLDHLGAADIVVAEGPGHFRDTEFLLDATGFGAMCKKLGLRFIDLNYDDLQKVPNISGVSPAKELYLPKTVMQCDALLSLPKLKTHHWVFMTASMKNLFGTVPGRKYGWPKNFLHINGISESIVDLVNLIKPKLALVDAIVGMEGDGPVNGKGKHMGFMVMGTDLAAVDATCARAISMNPLEPRYLRMASQVVGNVDDANISIVGVPLADVTQKIEMTPTFYDRTLLRNPDQGSS